MIWKGALGAGAALCCVGCADVDGSFDLDAATVSRFETASAAGELIAVGKEVKKDSLIDAAGAGFAYRTYTRANKVTAVAGLTATTSLGQPPVTGTATYKGQYALNYTAIARDRFDQSRADVRTFNPKGDITLSADFTAGTLTGEDSAQYMLRPALGAAEIGTRRFSVAGKIVGNELRGAVQYAFDETYQYGCTFVVTQKGTAQLEGLIDGQKAVAAFHGNGEHHAMAGGFLVTKE